jgi:hypothetical protein
VLKYLSGQESLVSIVTGYGLDGRGVRVQFLAGARDVTLLHSLQASVGPTQPAIQWVLGALSLE